MLYISTQDPRGADVEVSLPLAAAEFVPAGFPVNFHLGPFETRLVHFPAGRKGDLDIRTTTQRDQAIRVHSTNRAKLDIVGVNDEERSTDAFVALPCKLENPTPLGDFHTSFCKYFIFSAFQAGTSTSRFMIIPCTTGFNNGITYTIPGEGTTTLPGLTRYSVRLVESGTDLTGTVITSPYPLSFLFFHLPYESLGIS